MQKRDDERIIREFGVRQSRQFLAIAVTLVLLLILTLLYKRTDLFGKIPKNSIVAAQVVVVAGFAGFSAFNWRCPACGRYLGSNIARRVCRRCGARFR